MEFEFKAIERVPDPNQKLKDLAEAAEKSPQSVTFPQGVNLDDLAIDLGAALKRYGRFIVSVVAGGVYVEANPKPKQVRTRLPKPIPVGAPSLRREKKLIQ